jgi:hypothetical protein
MVSSKPDLFRVAMWRNGARPADGLSPPFDNRFLEDRARRCNCILINSGTESVIKIPSDLMREIEAVSTTDGDLIRQCGDAHLEPGLRSV